MYREIRDCYLMKTYLSDLSRLFGVMELLEGVPSLIIDYDRLDRTRIK